MAPSTPSTTPPSRKILRLGLAVVAVCIVYTGGWHLAATTLEQRIETIFEKQNPLGAVVECQNRELRGFPFRIGLFCEKLAFDDHRNGISASFGDFRSAAQIYAPGHIVSELDGPGEIRSTNGTRVSLQWHMLRSSVVTSTAYLERSSAESQGLRATVVTPDVPVFDVATASSEMHIRRNGEDLDYAAIGRDIRIAVRDSQLTLPPFSASVDLTVADRADLMDYDRSGGAIYGTKGQLRRVTFDFGEGRVVMLSGPLEVGEDGRLNGKLRVELEGISGLADTLKAVMPDAANEIDTASNLLTALFGGNQKGATDIRIRNGVVTLGLFPIGEIPPL
ncbi:DUF2125 domain-containing protein [Ciceribacter sp. L1K23]|uniref:DUF2125 domain-containing protein n=1 Tax=Ciceribacter sp. L1K23 TaxID=2820276 RepID=UPI001B8190EE|nr:DUF2125 domain-containing protein [Ciceribacter sp. L1K23]MBR0554242.1 DUF2125 domain-containing protein [Ciceribacter sp. L1K23]